ncbi:hypothetical protein chiPu_0011744 [Chiloscyllium punctatum]|uniref:Uncharacterized protein n=1 Tax=Chiloscyllium punctatum TaxID=137246 RepID=A0A401SSA0_CHIPU|nr:hypothetical protein [Chiloscyllium punctatum]
MADCTRCYLLTEVAAVLRTRNLTLHHSQHCAELSNVRVTARQVVAISATPGRAYFFDGTPLLYYYNLTTVMVQTKYRQTDIGDTSEERTRHRL